MKSKPFGVASSNFLMAIVSRLKGGASQVIDSSLLGQASWFLVNDYSKGNKIIYLFKANGDLLLIRNGVIEKGKWESISHSTHSLVIETSGSALFYNILYLSNEYLILQQDGTESYLGFVKQEKYGSQLDIRGFEELKDLYLEDLKGELNSRNKRKLFIYPEEQANEIGSRIGNSFESAPPQRMTENALKYSFKSSYQSSDLVLHKLNGKWGYIDPEFNVVIDFKFEDAYPFSEDLACVVVDGLRGYINPHGEIVITPCFDRATFFKDGIAEVVKNGETFRIDYHGNRVSNNV